MGSWVPRKANDDREKEGRSGAEAKHLAVNRGAAGPISFETNFLDLC